MMRGGSDLFESARAVEARAASLGIAPLVVEAAAMQAHALLWEGALEEATTVARRASRMARTEELPQPQYLANLVLVRVRRFQNRSHLAVRISMALSRKAPALWRTRMRWELLLAAGPFAVDEFASEEKDAAEHVKHALLACADADRVRFEASLNMAAEMCRDDAAMSADLGAIRVCADPDAEDVPVLGAWRLGGERLPPGGLSGLAPRRAGDALGLVAAHPSRGARRVLMVGAPFAGPLLTSSRPGRAETALSVLALAGAAGLNKAEFFRQIYGFEFVADLHNATLDTLLHRVRALLGEHGEVVRQDDHLRLEVGAPFGVPDPRCERPLEDSILHAIAQRAGSAKDIARQMDVPLRTVQLLLKGLVEDGACQSERDGRQIAYRVEDTTFHEPTRTSIAIRR